MPGPQPRLHLPYDQWPQIDRGLWARAIESADPFGDAPGGRLAKTSQHQYLFGWRRFLGFLANEEPAALKEVPHQRLTIERVRSFVAHLAETNTPHSVAIQVDALYKAARIMMPECDWTWLKAVKARLYATAPGGGSTGPVITSVQLLELGLQIMDESKLGSCTAVRMADAVHHRDGLMIALLAFVPLRRKNLAALAINHHLIREGESWFITVPPEETKTSTAIEFAVPELLTPYLSTYLDTARPRMLRRPDCVALWVSPKGGALSYSAIWDIISRHTARRIGIRVAPHDVRDAAATTWAIAAPDRIGVARDLLSHSDLRTTTKHYNRAKGIEASRACAEVIAGLRKSTRSR
jgi:integrase/recombinase XerD